MAVAKAGGPSRHSGVSEPGITDASYNAAASDRGHSARIANGTILFIVSGSMKLRTAVVIIVSAFASVPFAFGGPDGGASSSIASSDEPPRFDFAIESAYLYSFFNPPHRYEIDANFLTTRVRWGTFLDREGLFRGYNQVYCSFLAEPIFRGIENHYFGINLGPRYNFVRPGSRFVPFCSAGIGLGWIDSQPEQFGGQGQDFTFNIVGVVGVSYQFSDRCSGQVGFLYQHFSNAGQTNPNPSLNLFGLQVGLTRSF